MINSLCNLHVLWTRLFEFGTVDLTVSGNSVRGAMPTFLHGLPRLFLKSATALKFKVATINDVSMSPKQYLLNYYDSRYLYLLLVQTS